MAPAHIPQTGFILANSFKLDIKSYFSQSIPIVLKFKYYYVDSPPGIIKPSIKLNWFLYRIYIASI